LDSKKEISSLKEAVGAYFQKEPHSLSPYGNGHINDTFLVENGKRYILQRMNTYVFPKPEKLMENILGVTEHIRRGLSENNGDVERGTLTVLPTLKGNDYYVDSEGGYWRLYKFIEDSVTFEKVEKPQDFYLCAKAFGHFGKLLAEYPVERLGCTVENLHNTPWRYEKLMEAYEGDAVGRASFVTKEIEFVKSHKELAWALENAHREGKLPLRVTHNDTKLNNILFDKYTHEPVCVIDLDTVMPGYSVTDFGDSIRFGANRSFEDETNLDLVGLDLELYKVYARGYTEGFGGNLTADELSLLPVGAMVITLECGMRFLTDYLVGDLYFKIHRPMHNLERARCQFALLADMEKNKMSMTEIINELKKQ